MQRKRKDILSAYVSQNKMSQRNATKGKGCRRDREKWLLLPDTGMCTRYRSVYLSTTTLLQFELYNALLIILRRVILFVIEIIYCLFITMSVSVLSSPLSGLRNTLPYLFGFAIADKKKPAIFNWELELSLF